MSGTEVENENFFSQISLEQMDKAASSMIAKNVTASSCAAFVLGLPGGFATKAVPIVGGVVSGGITVATMIPMSNRLKNELRKYYLSEEEIFELEQVEEKEKISFGEKASDAISDVAVGEVKIAHNTKISEKVLLILPSK